jgi:hypothetical protein
VVVVRVVMMVRKVVRAVVVETVALEVTMVVGAEVLVPTQAPPSLLLVILGRQRPR